jgi:hypothetical protein
MNKRINEKMWISDCNEELREYRGECEVIW